MNTFKIGDGVRQKSTGGTGGITGIHPVLPPTTGKTAYTVRFNFGQPTSKVPEEDLELFVERRSGNERRNVQDRRRLVIVKLQGQCVLECLAKILGPSVDVRKMFDESISCQGASVTVLRGLTSSPTMLGRHHIARLRFRRKIAHKCHLGKGFSFGVPGSAQDSEIKREGVREG